MPPPETPPARRQGTQPDVNIEHTKTVEVHESPTQLEVHEHIEVKEPVRVVRVEDVKPAPVKPERHDEREVRRDRVWHSYTAVRRDRRFGLAALALGFLMVAAGAWMMNGALRVETFMATFTPDQSVVLLALVLVVGLILAAGAADGVAVSLFLGWLAGLGALVAAVHQALREPMSGAGQLLTALVGLTGLFTLAATTLGLASWRGQRIDERISVHEQRRRERAA